MNTAFKVIVFLMAVAVAGAALVSLVGPDYQSPVYKELLATIPWAGYTHIVFGSLALVLGGFQMSSRLRRRNIGLHKVIGNAYVGSVLVATIGAFAHLPFSETPWPAASAFWLLAFLWPIVTLAGYPRGEKFDFQWHGKLMIYSYALTCAAITLRLILGVLLVSGVSFPTAYPFAAWGGMLINIAIAFLVLNFVAQKRQKLSAA